VLTSQGGFRGGLLPMIRTSCLPEVRACPVIAARVEPAFCTVPLFNRITTGTRPR